MTTARDITRVIRTLHPAPVRLSVRDITCAGGPGFLLRLPVAPATCHDPAWLEGYLTRHLGCLVTVSREQREIRRRDCGRDVEFTLTLA
jgi:hypothetical protein